MSIGKELCFIEFVVITVYIVVSYSYKCFIVYLVPMNFSYNDCIPTCYLFKETYLLREGLNNILHGVLMQAKAGLGGLFIIPVAGG